MSEVLEWFEVGAQAMNIGGYKLPNEFWIANSEFLDLVNLGKQLKTYGDKALPLIREYQVKAIERHSKESNEPSK